MTRCIDGCILSQRDRNDTTAQEIAAMSSVATGIDRTKERTMPVRGVPNVTLCGDCGAYRYQHIGEAGNGGRATGNAVYCERFRQPQPRADR